MQKLETIAFWHGRLPHWEVVDGRYFITLHLAGAIPREAAQRIHSMSAALRKIPKSSASARLDLQRRIFAKTESWLDRAQCVSHLAQPNVATMVREAIEHRESRDWRVFEYVLMPSHLHLFCEMHREGLKSIVEDFKRWTGHEAAKLLGRSPSRFWQDEWFDHWSRSDEEDEKIVNYIRQNPAKARLVNDYLQWPYASWSK